MKKFTLALLACATALAISPVASAQTYNFSFAITGSGVNASGVITATQVTGDPGVYDITGISGTYSDSNGTPVVNAAITGLYPDPTNAQIITTSYLFSLDNLLYPAGNSPTTCFWGNCNSGQYLDIAGLVFNVAGGNEVGISGVAGTGFAGPYNLDRDISGVYQDGGNNGVGVLFSVPEGGATLLYLLLAGAGSFGAIFFRSRNGVGSPALA